MIQINKEGKKRYKREYLFPDCEGTWVKDKITKWRYDSFYGKFKYDLVYSYEESVASFGYDIFSSLCVCPNCRLKMYGTWYINKPFEVSDGDADNPQKELDLFVKANITRGEAKRLAQKEQKRYQPIAEKINKEIQDFKELKQCPLCGTLLTDKRETNYTVNDYDFDEFWVKPKAYARDVIEKIQQTTMAKQVDVDVSKLEKSPKLMRDYLKHLLDIEMTTEFLTKRLHALYNEQNHYLDYYEEELVVGLGTFAEKHWKQMKKRTSVNALMPEQIQLDRPVPIKPRLDVKEPEAPNYETPTLFNKKKVQEQNELLEVQYLTQLREYREKKAVYEEKLKEYQEELKEYRKEQKDKLAQLKEECMEKEAVCQQEFCNLVEQKKAEFVAQSPNLAVKNMISNEIKMVEQLLTHSCVALKSLYEIGVVYEKYRHPVALASFYDYFSSGRCSALAGHDGAYNLYENEVRMELIVTKLDVISRQLEQIKQNQYALYDVMSNVNRQLDELNQTTRNIASSLQELGSGVGTLIENTEMIAHNTAATAIYTKRTAQLTNALGFMVALK